MKGYKYAISWIVLNDDTTGIDFAGTPTMALVADLFNQPDEKVLKDVKKVIKLHEDYARLAHRVANSPDFLTKK